MDNDLGSGNTKNMMDNAFTAEIDRKFKFTPNLVESLRPTNVNIIPELMICYDLKNKC